MTIRNRVLLTALFVAAFGCAASAQIRLGYGVFATGGGMMSNGTYAAAGTVGQSVIGRSVTGQSRPGHGFSPSEQPNHVAQAVVSCTHLLRRSARSSPP